jgi:hypothetical protein
MNEGRRKEKKKKREGRNRRRRKEGYKSQVAVIVSERFVHGIEREEIGYHIIISFLCGCGGREAGRREERRG